MNLFSMSKFYVFRPASLADENLCEEWSDANQVARCFAIGKQESMAVSNLMSNINPAAVVFLTDSIRSRGMQKYMLHELLGRDVLNTNWTSGFNDFDPWKEQFRNLDDGELVPWY